VDKTKDVSISVTHPLSEENFNLIKNGGLIADLKKKNQKA
jgi:hypothetical protein